VTSSTLLAPSSPQSSTELSQPSSLRQLALEKLSEWDSASKTRQDSIRHFLSAEEPSTERSESLRVSLKLEAAFRKSCRSAKKLWMMRGTSKQPTHELVSLTETLRRESDTLSTTSELLMSNALSDRLSAQAETWTQLSTLCASTSEDLKELVRTSTASSTP